VKNTMNINVHTEKKEEQAEIQLPVNLRDYFAAKAMHAMIASGKLPTGIMIDTAEEAYIMADHMMKARGQK